MVIHVKHHSCLAYNFETSTHINKHDCCQFVLKKYPVTQSKDGLTFGYNIHRRTCSTMEDALSEDYADKGTTTFKRTLCVLVKARSTHGRHSYSGMMHWKHVASSFGTYMSLTARCTEASSTKILRDKNMGFWA